MGTQVQAPTARAAALKAGQWVHGKQASAPGLTARPPAGACRAGPGCHQSRAAANTALNVSLGRMTAVVMPGSG